MTTFIKCPIFNFADFLKREIDYKRLADHICQRKISSRSYHNSIVSLQWEKCGTRLRGKTFADVTSEMD